MYMPNILQGFGLEILLIAGIGYLWIQSLKNRKTETLSAFFNLCTALLLFLIVNVPVRISDLHLVKWDPIFVFVINAIYKMLEALTAYEWLVYFLTVQESSLLKRKGIWTILRLPLLLLAILIIASYKTHWLFYVNENGEYTRGTLFFLQFIIPYCYLLASFVCTFVEYKKNRDGRMFKILLIAFSCSIIASILQVLFSGSFSLAGLSMVVILAYMEIYQNEIKQIEKMKSLSVVNEQLAIVNEKLNETVKELEISVANEKAANNAKNDFLSRMSHDIRTPLNGILGIIEIDERYPDDVKLLSENRKKAKTAANHLVSLINDILDMSKLSSGKYEIAHEPFVMSQLMDEIFTIVNSNANKKGITLINENANDTFVYPATFGSPLHISRVLINIIGNAIKYNKENGSVSVRLEHENAGDEKIKYKMIVSDTGIGMSEEYIKTLFEPFSQERIDARSVYEGAGLGMAITKALIEKMGGTIAVESEVGVGSKFIIDVDFEIAPDDNLTDVQIEESLSLDGYRILLAEDNDLNIDIAKTLLEDSGAIVDVAENGKLAVEKFENSPKGTYDVILMDCMMPVLDGYEATKIIRNLSREDAAVMPIIAMTANAFSDDVRKCLDAGMNDHLPKPFEIKKVIKTILKYTNN